MPIGARLAASMYAGCLTLTFASWWSRDVRRYKLLLGVSPSLEDLADEFPEDYDQVSSCRVAIVSRVFPHNQSAFDDQQHDRR